MTTLPICDELRRSVNSSDWVLQFILRCHREISDDVRMCTEINALCARLTVIVDERVNFVNELDMLAPEFVPVKMAELMKQIQDKDIQNLMKLQILGSLLCVCISVSMDNYWFLVFLYFCASCEQDLFAISVPDRDLALCFNRMRGDRVVAFEDRAAFVYELENVTGVSVTAKTGVFLKEIMEKEDVGTGT
ncbi:hypothetical protein Tco_0444628 [Tanacetum coccineum]